MKVTAYNDIFVSMRREPKIISEIPTEVLKAYDTLKNYVEKTNSMYYAERMVAELHSIVLQKCWSTSWSGTQRITPPSWLKKHCERYEAIPRQLGNIGYYDWSDHWKYIKSIKTGKIVLMSEPYRQYLRGINIKEMQDLINTCNELNIGCKISASSMHYPGATIALLFYEKRNDAK